MSSLDEKNSMGSMNYDDWDCVSESEVALEEMENPFKEKWKQIERKYFLES